MQGKKRLKQADQVIATVGRVVSNTTLVVCSIMLIIVTIEIIIGVFFRYVLRTPIYWSEEVARYILVWMAMLGASVSTERREHLRLDSLMDLVPLAVQKIVAVLLGILVIVMLILVFPWIHAMLTGPAGTTLSPAVRIPMVIPLSSLAVGFVLLIFQTAIVALRDLLSLFITDPKGDGTE